MILDRLTLGGGTAPFENLPAAGAHRDGPCNLEPATLPLDEPLERYLERDPFPLPATADREGYHGERHFEYWLSGLRDYLLLRDRLRAAGAELVAGDRVLDFGCASGRVLRHLLCQGPPLDLWGCDINARHVEWLRRFLGRRLRPVPITVVPHLPLEDDSCALAIGFSVFTHIDEMELAWLAELRRVLRPGGVAYLTLHTDYTWERLTDGVPVREALRDMFCVTPGAEEAAEALGGPMPAERVVFRTADGGPYSTNVFHSSAYVGETWGRLFEIFATYREGADYQDVVLLRKSPVR